MSANELSQIIGRQATWKIFDLDVPVTVTDARRVFGRTDIQIQPIGGGGRHWCADRAVTIIETGVSYGGV